MYLSQDFWLCANIRSIRFWVVWIYCYEKTVCVDITYSSWSWCCYWSWSWWCYAFYKAICFDAFQWEIDSCTLLSTCFYYDRKMSEWMNECGIQSAIFIYSFILFTILLYP